MHGQLWYVDNVALHARLLKLAMRDLIGHHLHEGDEGIKVCCMLSAACWPAAGYLLQPLPHVPT